MKHPQRLELRVTRRFAAPPERVFDAWLDPASISGFVVGPEVRDEQVLRIELDARVGGAFSFLVRRQGQEIDHVGHYFEIDRPRRLVFSWSVGAFADESRVTIEIAPRAGGCELTLVHQLLPEYAEYLERTQQGWTHIVASLEKQLSSPRRSSR
jgi:uncharacterized protein YndB with AHSA1/START domain